jgi:hypothetical protein
MFITLKAGEHWLVTESDGKVQVAEGPRRILRWGKTFEKIEPVRASEREYIVAKHLDGRTEYIVGPTVLIPHPAEYAGAQVEQMRFIHRGETLLVYRQKGAGGSGDVERIILNGPCTYVPGSATEWTKEVQTVVAADDEYLRVTYLDGRAEFRSGPCSMIKDPEHYRSVEVKDALRIGDQELIVVYRKKDAKVERNLVRGPQLYIPATPEEWVHQFSWTGAANPNQDTSGPMKKKADALKFTKLRTSPGKMYVDVESVRTKDNALLVVKLMIFYRLEDVDKMIDGTSDPFGEFINSVSADVIEWCVSKTFDEFLANTEQLNTLKAYSQLVAVGAKIGMPVDNCVFRGYTAPPALQRMHDQAIEKRTEMGLMREEEVERQKITDLTLQQDASRAAQQQQMELERTQHELKIEAQRAAHDRELKKSQFDVELHRLERIKQIDANADIGRYLIAKEGHPSQVVQCSTVMAADSPLFEKH